ncbi:hemerythrin domain-containing protein [Chitinibacteraceae bacterium HSL-7]
MMTLQPAPGFDDPVALLCACHDKVRHFSQLAVRIAKHVDEMGCDSDAQSAALAVMRYFDIAAPLHHADEELDLFPALAALGDARLDDAIRQISAEHEELGALWSVVRLWLERVAAGEACAPPDVLAAFAERYATHAAREELEIFCRASELPSGCLNALGQRMAARRGG